MSENIIEPEISAKELAKQIREAADILNELLEAATKRNLKVTVNVNDGYRYDGPIVNIGKISQDL